MAPREPGHESDVLLRQLDRHLTALRARGHADLALAERMDAVLRCLIADTAVASAADRARVRAAVHYFVLRREPRGERRGGRTLAETATVIDDILRALGRADLLITLAAAPV